MPGVQYLVAKYAYQARLPDVTPHTLRHTFGKNLVDTGVSLEQVAALLGHESLDTVMIYTKPSHGDLEKAVRRALASAMETWRHEFEVAGSARRLNSDRTLERNGTRTDE